MSKHEKLPAWRGPIPKETKELEEKLMEQVEAHCPTKPVWEVCVMNLHQILDGDPTASLPAWMSDPETRDAGIAWVMSYPRRYAEIMQSWGVTPSRYGLFTEFNDYVDVVKAIDWSSNRKLSPKQQLLGYLGEIKECWGPMPDDLHQCCMLTEEEARPFTVIDDEVRLPGPAEA
jgi:hypothetical protein